ncbi:MAG: serine hydrolase [Eubacteriales bacterium]|nr:serine hydrolase [Eubacteriales bacterium]
MAISACAITRFVERLRQEDVCLHGFELRHNSAVRAEGYYAPFRKGEPHRMYSVSKSVVSLAIGLLAQDGVLRLDDRIASFFPDLLPANPDPRLLRLTMREMLRMATCYQRTTYREREDANWAATFFSAPADHEPGTVFAYDTSCSQVLALLCQRLSGEPLLGFLNRRIFTVIGANDPKHWLTDPSGVPQGGTGLCMSLRDLGKLAQAILNDNSGAMPVSYLQKAVSRQIDTPFQKNPEERYGYGYQFWRTRNGFSMYGMGGQLAIFCPERQLILCTIADTRLDAYGVQRIYDAFYEEIVNAPEIGRLQVEEEQALDAMLSKLRVGALPHDDHAQAHFAKSYRMEANPLGLCSVQFSHNELSFIRREQTDVLPYRFGEVTLSRLSGIPCLISAGLVRDGTLRLRCFFIGDAPCGFDMLLSQNGAYLTVQSQRSGDPLTDPYEGFAWGQQE